MKKFAGYIGDKRVTYLLSEKEAEDLVGWFSELSKAYGKQVICKSFSGEQLISTDESNHLQTTR